MINETCCNFLLLIPDKALPVSHQSTEATLSPDEVEKCRRDLITHYDKALSGIRTDIFSPNSEVDFDKIYTQLFLLKQDQNEETNETTESQKRHDESSIFNFFGMDSKHVTKENLSNERFYDIITPGEPNENENRNYRILIAGEAGVGKTTFLSKLTNDWKTGKYFQNIKLLFRIPLREAEKSECFGNVVQKYLSDVNIYGTSLDEYIRTHQGKVMLLLDGLDEFCGEITENENDNVLSQIMAGEKFKECIVIIATRLWRADKISNIRDFQKKFTFISIEGFAEKDQQVYTDKFFQDDKEKAESIKHFLKRDGENDGFISKVIAPCPIYMAMLCHMWQDVSARKEVARLETVSEFLNLMGDTLKMHYQMKKNKLRMVERNEKARNCFINVGKVVYPHDPISCQRELVFNKKDLGDEAKSFETACEVGIMTRELRIAPMEVRRKKGQLHEIEYRIYHLLLKDFLVAQYLASLYTTSPTDFETKLKQLLLEKKEDVFKFEHVWYFTATQGKEVGRSVLEILQGIGNKNLLIRVAFECHNTVDPTAFIKHALSNRSLHITANWKRCLISYVFARMPTTLVSIESIEFSKRLNN